MEPFDEKPEALDRLWDPQLELLGELLNQLESDDAMDLEELDGFFAALHCGPDHVMPGEYLDEITAGHEFSDMKAAQLFLDLVIRHWNAVGAAFRADDVFIPLLLEDDQGKSYGNDWAIGFLRGVEMRRESWNEVLDEETIHLLEPVFALAHELDPDPTLRPFDGAPLTDEQRENLFLDLSDSVTELFRGLAPFRQSFPSESGPAVRKQKIGRNDPCYCGSGKKYKKCCGGIKVI